MKPILNAMRMDLIGAYRKAKVPMILLLLLTVPFALYLYPAAAFAAVIFSGMFVYTVFGIEDREHLTRLYSTLPMKRSHLIIGRFLAGGVGIFVMTMLSVIVGFAALNLRLYAFFDDAYIAVLRDQAEGRTMFFYGAAAFCITAVLTAYLYMFNSILGKHRELYTILITGVLLFAAVIAGMEFSVSPFGAVLTTAVRLFEQSTVLFEAVMYLIGTAALLLGAGIAVLFSGRREWQ